MKLRFIVIDDEPGIREVLRQYLVFLGHEVICAENPTVERICNKTQCDNEFACADSYFVDNDMPKKTGIEYLEDMARRGCKVPVQNRVLMSGNFSQNVVERAINIACTVLDKPFNFQSLSGLVDGMSKHVDPNRKLNDLTLLSTD